MKPLLFACFFISVSAAAQVTVSHKVTEPTLSPGKIEHEEYERLKNSTTIFVYRENDTIGVDEEAFEQMLKDAWTCTKGLLPMTRNEFREFEPEDGVDYSFWTIGSVKKTIESDTKITERKYIFLKLSMLDGEEEIAFSRIDFHPSWSTVSMYSGSIDDLYQHAELHNWFAGYLKNALQEVSRYITNEEERSYFERGSTEDVGQLSSNTLYIPDYTLIKFNAFTGDETERHDVAKLFGRYKFDYKVVSKEELSEMILDTTKTIYYFSYVKSSTHIFYNVINSKTGEIVYSFYKGNHYNLKPKRIAKLQHAVKRNS